MDNNHSPKQVWQTALGQLQMQMTQATFDTWVKNTEVISAEAGRWQIGTKSAFAKDWLENRLFSTINRTVTNILGGPVELKFVVQENGNGINGVDVPERVEMLPGDYADFSPVPTPPPPTTPQSSFNPPATNGLAADIRVMCQFSYQPLPPYYPLYILPYLKSRYGGTIGMKTYLFWEQQVAISRELLKSKNFRNWTNPGKPSSLHDLANMSKICNDDLTGQYRYCEKMRQSVLNKQSFHKCCGSYQDEPHEFKKNCHCRRWYTGILEILSQEGMLVFEESGGRRNYQIIIQVWRSWPILSPHQVNAYFSFSSEMQAAHKAWILTEGAKVGCPWEKWVSESAPSGIEQYTDREINKKCQRLFLRNPFLKQNHL